MVESHNANLRYGIPHVVPSRRSSLHGIREALRPRARSAERPAPASRTHRRLLIGAKGEISGLGRLARSILDGYERSDDAGRLAFFRHLAQDMAIDPDRVRTALGGYEAGAEHGRATATFMAAAEPPRQELIRRLNQVPGATGALVEMRATFCGWAGRRPA